MSAVTLKLTSDLAPQVQHLLSRVLPQLAALLPSAEIEHIGATAVPGSITKGDVDVLARVSPAAFLSAVEILRAYFCVKQPTNWTPTFASFGDDLSYALPLGVQLVASGADNDFLSYLRDFLNSSPGSLAEYNQLKIRHSGDGAEAYWRAKHLFFTKVLAARGKSPTAGNEETA